MKKILLVLGSFLILTQGCLAMEAESAFLQELRTRFAHPQDVITASCYNESASC